MAKPAKPSTTFSDADAAQLDELLFPRLEQGGLPFEAVDGLLSSIVVAPELILPSQWMPIILGENPEPWASEEEFATFNDLVMRLYNHIIERVVPEPSASSMPFIAFPEEIDDMDQAAIDAIEYPLGGNWAVGFMIGVGLCGDAWDALAQEDEDVRDDFGMIVALLPNDLDDDESDEEDSDEEEGDLDSAVDVDASEEKAPLRWSADDEDEGGEDDRPLTGSERIEIITDLGAALHHMNLVRLAGRNSKEPLRREMKIGRNDLCSCGSGKKYKKCHGASIN